MAYQFRAEFVRSNPDPLNSDMFSGFNYYDSVLSGPSKDMKVFEDAQSRIWTSVREFAAALDTVQEVAEIGALFCDSQDDIRSLRSRMHRRGINVCQKSSFH